MADRPSPPASSELPARILALEAEVAALRAELAIRPPVKIPAPQRENTGRFRALLESVPGAVYEWRADAAGGRRFGYVSPQLGRLFGLAAADQLLACVHPDDRAALRAALDEGARTGETWTHDFRLCVPGQPERWCRATAAPAGRDAAGARGTGLLQDITPLKRAERAVDETNARWRRAVEGLGYGVWDYDLDTGRVHYSPRFKAMLGYRDDAFPDVYASWHDAVHPDDLPRALAALDDYMQGRAEEYACDHRVRGGDGAYNWVRARGVVTDRAPDGRPTALTGTQEDLAPARLSEETLEMAARQLAAVIGCFPDGLVLEDAARRVVLANDAFGQWRRRPVAPGADGARLAAGLAALAPDPGAYRRRAAAVVRAGRPVAGELVALADGRVLERDYVPLVAQGRPVGHLWRYADVSARVRAEEELKRREEKYRSALEHLQLGLVELDLAGQVRYANASFCRLTGFTLPELIASGLTPLHPRAADGTDDGHRADQTAARELVITTKDGAVKRLVVSSAPVYDAAQQEVGTMVLHLDVTERQALADTERAAAAAAAESVRVKQQFLANMSHEMRTPLNAIVGMSRLLARAALPAAEAGYLHALTASADNLRRLVDDVLDLARLDAAGVAAEAVGFRPADVLAGVAQALGYKADEQGLAFETAADPALPAVLVGDPHRLHQILLNLAGNAVKFTERGQVSVRCALLQPPARGVAEVEFTVQDTGVGIDPAYLARAFDDFSQEDASVARRFGGTGLGLGISRRLVALLGGELRLESVPDRGTTARFVLRLPAGTARDLPAAAAAPNVAQLRAALRGKRVLLAEDNAFNRLLARAVLERVELAVTEAENGEQAVAHARAQPFDLVLMDVQMPVLNGLEATRRLRAELGLATPVIALTANVVEGERERCLDAGMDDFLGKPFDEAALLHAVHRWAGGGLPPAPAGAPH